MVLGSVRYAVRMTGIESAETFDVLKTLDAKVRASNEKRKRGKNAIR